MKALSFFQSALFIAGVLLAVGCQKETSAVSGEPTFDAVAGTSNKPMGHRLKCQFDLTYTLVPDVEAGNTQYNHPPGWYLAIGEGHMNLLGKASTFSNQYIKYVDGSQDSLTVQNVSINKFFKDTLSALGYNNIPDEVSLIFLDKQGNSLWSRGEEPFGHVFRSDGYFRIDWVYDVIGGTGKFEGASGNFIFSGYQNLSDTTDTGFDVVDGLIAF